MKAETITINYFQCAISELEAIDRNLIKESQNAIEGSYSPYSKFSVGAAVLLDNGEIVRGANQENCAYPSGMCAERVALYSAGANYKNNDVIAIAITAKNEKGELTEAYPCGACLQVMVETQLRAKQKLRIIVQKDTELVQIFNGIESLMPFSFTL
ncbi:MAG: cytidine deaminase [Bacteroidales bacterium]|jgi:cytidine deaminase